MGNLQGKVALITGAARGIGAGIAKCLAAEGASVAILDLDIDSAKSAAAALGASAIGLQADASDEEAMAKAVEKTVATFGGIDIMVNNAGGLSPDVESMGLGNPFTNITLRGWDLQLQNNLRTTFVGCKTVIPHLQVRGGGSIVNIASMPGCWPCRACRPMLLPRRASSV